MKNDVVKKVAKVFEDRRQKNDVVSIINHGTGSAAGGNETDASCCYCAFRVSKYNNLDSLLDLHVTTTNKEISKSCEGIRSVNGW